MIPRKRKKAPPTCHSKAPMVITNLINGAFRPGQLAYRVCSDACIDVRQELAGEAVMYVSDSSTIQIQMSKSKIPKPAPEAKQQFLFSWPVSSQCACVHPIKSLSPCGDGLRFPLAPTLACLPRVCLVGEVGDGIEAADAVAGDVDACVALLTLALRWPCMCPW